MSDTRKALEEAAKDAWGWECAPDGVCPDFWVKRWYSFRHKLEAEAYLDAAVMLAGEDAFWRVGHDGAGPDPSMYKAEFILFPLSPNVAVAETPALALLAAILKTKEQNDE